MRLLDLFCGAGGAAMGYHRAGFDEIVGVDIEPQPNYPFKFIQGDALLYLDAAIANKPLMTFDLVHASPPCQIHSSASNKSRHKHIDFIEDTRNALEALGLPYVIENVPGAPIRRDLILCGTMFGLGVDGYELRRHRYFELSGFPLILVPSCQHQKKALSVVGKMTEHRARTHAPHRLDKTSMRSGRDDARTMMEVPWMSDRNQGHEMAEAIPPAYTEYIGKAFLEQQSEAPVSP